MTPRLPQRIRRLVVGSLAMLLAGVVATPAMAGDASASLSDVRSKGSLITATLILRTPTVGGVDDDAVQATVGGQAAPVKVSAVPGKPPSTMLVIDTSGSMGPSGMATVRRAVKDFLAAVPSNVKVGVVSFASTSGVDVAPTTNRAKVQSAVDALRSKGETALYAAVQDAVEALGTTGERSIVLLSDGGDTVAQLAGGAAQEKSQRAAAVKALKAAKVRAEVVAFKSAEGRDDVLKQFATAGGGQVATAGDSAGVTDAFAKAARTLESQVSLQITRPPGVEGSQQLVVSGTTKGAPFSATATVDVGEAAPVVLPTPTTDTTIIALSPKPLTETAGSWTLPAALLGLAIGLFLLVAATMTPALATSRRQRVSAIDDYALGGRVAVKKEQASTSAISQQLIHMGDRVMEGRESTTRTMALLDRADLPWRAGEWFVLRIVAVLVGSALGYFLLRNRNGLIGLLIGLVVGIVLPAVMLRYLAKRRARKFESVLPDVMMLTATSLASGFSLLQALDAVAKDAPEPAAKEFSRALASTRIGADVSDALDQMAVRMDSANMRWVTMAIRIQREVGGNLAETLRTTAATLREREMLKRQVKALSAEGRLSAYVLILLPIGILLYSMWTNYDYVSLLWTTTLGLIMCFGGLVAMVAGIFWMRAVVKIEV